MGKRIDYAFPEDHVFSDEELSLFNGIGSIKDRWPTSTLTGPLYAPQHRWVFCSDQRPEEAWLFKQYDTRPGMPARQAFHNSFRDPFHEGDPTKPGRRSAE